MRILNQPDDGWKFLSVAGAAESQTTGLAALPTDQANNEIRAIINSGLNNAGAIQSGGVLMYSSLTDTRGRPYTGGKPFRLQWRYQPVTAPANASFIYATAGFTDKATLAALAADPQFFTAGLGYQPAANPRGIWLPRFDGGALAALAIGTGSAVGTSGGRAYFEIPMIRTDANCPGATSMLMNASNTALTNNAYNIGGIAFDNPATTFRFIICFGTHGGAEPAGNVAARTIGGKFSYRLEVDQENA